MAFDREAQAEAEGGIEPANPSATGGEPLAPTSRLRQAILTWSLGAGVMVFAAGLAWAVRDRMERARAETALLFPTLAAAAESARADGADPGKLAYTVHCARCHGTNGRGDGPDFWLQPPAPRDFRIRPWKHGENAEAVRKVVLEGIRGTAMAGWGRSLSAGELDAVVEYVRAFGPSRPSERLPLPLDAPLRRAGFVPSVVLEEAPRVSAESVDGQRQSLGTYRGSVILIAFWGTYCPPCLEEFPALEQVSQEFKDKGLVVLPICVDEADPVIVRRAAMGRADRLPVIIDRSGRTRLRYDVQSIPAAVLVDREGRLIGRVDGAIRWTSPEVRELLRAVIEEPD